MRRKLSPSDNPRRHATLLSRIDLPKVPFNNAHQTTEASRRPICWPLPSDALARSAARLSSTPAVNPPRTARRRVTVRNRFCLFRANIRTEEGSRSRASTPLGFMLLGPPGVGKTHLALGLAVAAAEHHESTASLEPANVASRLCAVASASFACRPPITSALIFSSS